MPESMDQNPAPVSSPLSIRPVSVDDFGALAALERAIQKTPWTESHFVEELAKPYSHTWVLTDDETDQILYGYIVFWEIDKTLQILNIGVAPEHQRGGLGTKLLRAAIGEGLRKGATRALLEVRKSNTSAITVYQRLGFAVDQIRKKFYSDDEDAYVFTLPLEVNPFPDF